MTRNINRMNHITRIWSKPELRGRIIGIKSRMDAFDYFYGVAILKLELRHSGNLSKTLQKPSTTACHEKTGC